MHRIARFASVLLASAMLLLGADFAALADPMPTDMGEVATPNHDPHHAGLMGTDGGGVPSETGVWSPVTLRAEPEVPAPFFVATDAMLYARANARLRAAPSTAAAVVAKLTADAPLHAIARSTDSVWWKVALADKRTGYVRRDAVTKYRMAKAKPPAATTSVAAASPLPTAAQSNRDGLLGLVDEAMNWLADVAGHGSPPKVIRAER